VIDIEKIKGMVDFFKGDKPNETTRVKLDIGMLNEGSNACKMGLTLHGWHIFKQDMIELYPEDVNEESEREATQATGIEIETERMIINNLKKNCGCSFKGIPLSAEYYKRLK